MPTVSSAQYVFNTNELLTLGIAAYAAIVSTFILGWDAYKWLAAGAKAEVAASPEMRLIGGSVPDSNTYITVSFDAAVGLPLNKPGAIFLYDDMLTSGAHYVAASSKLSEFYPGVQVFGQFIARRRFPNPFADFEAL